MKSFGVSDILS